MAESAWPPLLAALSYCIGTNLSDALFAEVLSALKDFTVACGLLSLTTPRDAFFGILGKYAVPPTVVSAMQMHMEGPSTPRMNSVINVDAISLGGLGASYSTPPPSLSERNLACLRSAIVTARLLAPSLGNAWHDVLETLQNANFMLAVRKPNLNRRATGASAHITSSPTKTGPSSDSGELRPQVFEDLDIDSIQAVINGLFDSSKELDDAAFSTFISALCRLSSEMIGMDANNTIIVDLSESLMTPSSSHDNNRRRSSGINISHSIKSGERSFSLTKLRTVSALNLSRLVSCDAELGWTTITQHLLAVSRHLTAPTTIRTQASDTLAELLLGAVRVGKDSRIQHQVFDVLVRQVDYYPISNTIATDFDVRVSGYQTLNQILESSGHSLEVGWKTIFGMLNNVCKEPAKIKGSDPPISIPTNNRPSGLFSKGEANLVRIAFPSLTLICTDFLSALDATAISQCVTCLGYFGRQREDVNITLAAIGLLWNVSDAVQADSSELWLYLLTELRELGRDTRPEVRSSAMQTLFRCVELYGNSLSRKLWEDVFWKIVFPLLEAGQGDESHVLALTAVGNIMNTFLPSITCLSSFERIFSRLLERFHQAFVAASRLCGTAALKALDRVLVAVDTIRDASPSSRSKILDMTWQTFLKMCESLSSGEPYTQENLIALVRVASLLHDQCVWTGESLHRLSNIICSIMTYTRSPEYRPDVDVMSPLQISASNLLTTSSSLGPSLILSNLAEFASLAYMGNDSTKLTYVALSKYSMPKMAEIFGRHSDEENLYEDGTVESMIGVGLDASLIDRADLVQAYSIPIKLKYDCPTANKYGEDPPLWKTVSARSMGPLRARADPSKAMITFAPILDQITTSLERFSTSPIP